MEMCGIITNMTLLIDGKLANVEALGFYYGDHYSYMYYGQYLNGPVLGHYKSEPGNLSTITGNALC